MNDFTKEYDTHFTEEVVCPYCGHEYSDSWEFNDYHADITCCECNKKFDFDVHFDVRYCTYKIKEGDNE